MNFEESKYFINRELSWIEFNKRVLQEAYDKNYPLLERLKFLAISASNLDEFFMVRVASIKDLVEAGFEGHDDSGLTPKEQLEQITLNVRKFVRKQYNCLIKSIIPAFKKEKVLFEDYSSIDNRQKDYLHKMFEEIIYPVLTPLAVDQSRPFPLLANKSLNLAVRLKGEEGELFALVQVPSVLPRIIEVPSGNDNRTFVFLEDVIIEHIGIMFTGYKVKAVCPFCITRNADLDIDEEEAQDLLKEIEESVARRKWGAPVRLEIIKGSDTVTKQFLIQMLEIGEVETYEVPMYLDLAVWIRVLSFEGFAGLKDTPLISCVPQDFWNTDDVFAAIREKDCLVHHPYESFDCVTDFIRQASVDPDVLAIKQTLYRVSGNSPIVESLITAAENGKQVTVLVELKARFDEAKNINWAKKLEKAGCHVVYGLVGLKIHCKAALVIRKEEDGIRRYVHMSTGNYNDQTAKLYTDIGLFTCRESFGADISALFNYLTGYSMVPTWKKIEAAPFSLRQFFNRMIDNEIQHVKQGKKGRIIAKMNSLADKEIIKMLYKASTAGVEVVLIVRGICCLRSGIHGLSENIAVISIVGRFLEHSRIYYFENSGQPRVYLSSADLMPRNLDRRVEIVFPVEQEKLKKRLMEILKISMEDTVKVRIQRKDGTYAKIDKRGKAQIQSQMIFWEKAKKTIEQLQKMDG